jgi:predicted unusual protein kinase regulating ubiquinone biosynthesis (AarF/ABC1/UbiB family)
MMDEVERQFLTEFDFTREARSLALLHHSLAPHFPDVTIPRPVEGLVTKDVLVMEKLDGEKLLDGIKRQYTAMAKEQGMCVYQQLLSCSVCTLDPFTITLWWMYVQA